MVNDDPFGSRVELPGPAIVPQPLPGTEHVRLRRLREPLDGRKPLREAVEEIDDPIDLRLLEHHLADPGTVGINPTAPGEIAPDPREPAEEGVVDRRHPGSEGRRERVVAGSVSRAGATGLEPPGSGPGGAFTP